MMSNSVASFWDDEVVPERRAEPQRVKRAPPLNRPRPGELDVRVYEVSWRTGFAFCNAWDYNTDGLLMSQDNISPIQVAIHISEIQKAYPTMVKEGARFRVVPSKTRPGSTFEYFGKLVSPI